MSSFSLIFPGEFLPVFEKEVSRSQTMPFVWLGSRLPKMASSASTVQSVPFSLFIGSSSERGGGGTVRARVRSMEVRRGFVNKNAVLTKY